MIITNKKTLQLFLDADKFALGKYGRRFPLLPSDDVWRYERSLRYYEYYKNTGKVILKCLFAFLLYIRGKRLGFSISGNCFGPGLRINHFGLVVVNAKAQIGKWCDIHQGVNIGENSYYLDSSELKICVPKIGNYVFIGPGAKIYGDVIVGNNVKIGANCVVHKSVQSNIIVFGNPQIEKQSNKKSLTIASPDFEKEFLIKYPQYKELLLSE